MGLISRFDLDNMANKNVPAPAPIRSDDQILPFATWVPIGKSNFVLDLQKKQRNPIFQISFWNTLTYEAKTGAYSFQLDENCTNVDYAELMWEEFVQAIQTFLADKANLGIATQKGKKTKPHVILYCRFTKLIICYLGRTHNIHQRSESPFHLAEEDYRLGNIKFIPKGEEDEVFGMQIPKVLITDNIRNASYYNSYLEMVAKHDRKIAAEEGGKKKSAAKADQSKKPATSKQLKTVPSKQSKPTLGKQPKPVTGKSIKPSPIKKAAISKVRKVRKGKSYLQLVDELEEEPQPAPEPQVEDEEFDLQHGITKKLPIVEGKGKVISTDEQVAQSLLELQMPKKTSTTDQYIFQRRILVTEEAPTGPFAQPEEDTSANIVCDTPSPTDAETGAEIDKTNSEGDTEILNIIKEQGEDVANQVNLEEKTAEVDKGQAGSTPESRPPPECVLTKEDQAGPNPGQSHVALAGPKPEPMHKDFVATVYPPVHESLKHIDEEHVHLENPLSSTRTLSSMKNLDNFNFGDQFFNDKPTEKELDKANMETKVESMVTFFIHQASSSIPPLSTPVIDLTPPKPVSPTLQALIFKAIIATTTTLLLPPPPQQQSSSDPDLVSRVSTLEQVCVNFEKRHKL
ncbi:hypothetical protein Tco_0785078 [Tanacetum coccineum]